MFLKLTFCTKEIHNLIKDSALSTLFSCNLFIIIKTFLKMFQIILCQNVTDMRKNHHRWGTLSIELTKLSLKYEQSYLNVSQLWWLQWLLKKCNIQPHYPSIAEYIQVFVYDRGWRLEHLERARCVCVHAIFLVTPSSVRHRYNLFNWREFLIKTCTSSPLTHKCVYKHCHKVKPWGPTVRWHSHTEKIKY